MTQFKIREKYLIPYNQNIKIFFTTFSPAIIYLGLTYHFKKAYFPQNINFLPKKYIFADTVAGCTFNYLFGDSIKKSAEILLQHFDLFQAKSYCINHYLECKIDDISETLANPLKKLVQFNKNYQDFVFCTNNIARCIIAPIILNAKEKIASTFYQIKQYTLEQFNNAYDHYVTLTNHTYELYKSIDYYQDFVFCTNNIASCIIAPIILNAKEKITTSAYTAILNTKEKITTAIDKLEHDITESILNTSAAKSVIIIKNSIYKAYELLDNYQEIVLCTNNMFNCIVKPAIKHLTESIQYLWETNTITQLNIIPEDIQNIVCTAAHNQVKELAIYKDFNHTENAVFIKTPYYLLCDSTINVLNNIMLTVPIPNALIFHRDSYISNLLINSASKLAMYETGVCKNLCIVKDPSSDNHIVDNQKSTDDMLKLFRIIVNLDSINKVYNFEQEQNDVYYPTYYCLHKYITMPYEFESYLDNDIQSSNNYLIQLSE